MEKIIKVQKVMAVKVIIGKNSALLTENEAYQLENLLNEVRMDIQKDKRVLETKLGEPNG